MPWTNPIPTQPNKQWIYINNTTTILGNTANEDSLICWAYAQGYTGLVLYQLNTLTGGTNAFTPANAALLTAFINKCNTNGIEVGGAFGGSNTIQAMIALGGFTAAVSEIEWYNYSHNLPYQKQDGSGAYSFYDTLQTFMSYKTQLNNAGITLITYVGFTKALNFAYNYTYPVVTEYKNPTTQGPNANGNLGLAINGNFTTDNTAPIVESKVFEADQVIKINNWPSPTLATYAKLDATTPVKLESGETTFNVASAETSNNVIIAGSYRPSISVATYSVTNGAYVFNVPGGHGILAGTRLVTNYTARPEFNTLGGNLSSGLDIATTTATSLVTSTTFANAVGKSPVASYQVTAGTLRLNFPTTADTDIFIVGDTVRVTGTIGPLVQNTNYVITNKGTTWVEVFNAAWANVTLTTISGVNLVVYTRATVTLTPPVIFYPAYVSGGNSPNVANLHEIVYIGPSRFFSPYAGEIALRGDKTYHFAPGRVSKIAIENYNIPSPSNLFEVVGTATYNAGLNQTRVFLTVDPITYVGSGPEYTTFLAMANLDVVYQTNSAYGIPGSELQQLIPHVNSYAITVYEQNIPNYGYVKNRVREIGQGIAAISGAYTPKVYYLFGAYNTASLNFYKGLNATGSNTATPWPKKGAKEAYDYVSFTLSGVTPTINNPPQVGSPISADAETDADVQAWVQIEGLLMFKFTDFYNISILLPFGGLSNIKNGTNILTGPTNPVLLNTSVTVPFPGTGSTALSPLTFCGDCLPKTRIATASRTSNVSTFTCLAPHSFTSTSIVSINGVAGNGFNGTYTGLTIIDGVTFTVNNPGPDEISINASNGFVTANSVVTWTVTPPGGGSGTVTNPSITADICSTNIPNTLNFNGFGTYTVTATINNPNAIDTSLDRVATKSVVYEVTVLSSAPPVLDASITGTVNNTCPGGSTGQISVGISPTKLGLPNYTYTLHTATPPTVANQIATSGSTASTSYTFTGLADGTYYILVTDAANQTITLTATVSSSVCNITPYITNVTCYGGSNGEIFLYISGEDSDCACGLGQSFQYSWSYNGVLNPAWNNLNPITGLQAGIYDVVVTTCAGCIQNYTFEVLPGKTIDLIDTAVSDATCGATNGFATITLDNVCPGTTTLWWIGGTTGTPANKSITNAVGNGTEVTYTTALPHNLFLGQLVYITGMSPSTYDTPFNYPTAAVIDIPTPDSFKIASTAVGAVSVYGQAFTDFINSPYTNVVYDPITSEYSITLGNIPAGPYYLTGFDSCICYYTSPTITVPPLGLPPVVDIVNEPITGKFILCAADKAGITIDAQATITDCGGKNPSYAWTNLATGVTSTGNTFDNSNLTIFYPGIPGGGAGNVLLGSNPIQLQVTDCNGCTTTVNTEVVVVNPTKPVTGLTISGGPLTNCPSSTLPYLIEVQGGVTPAPSQGFWAIDGIPQYSIQDYPILSVDNTFFEGPTYVSNNTIFLSYFQYDINGCVSTTGSIKVEPPIPISLTVVVKNNPCGGPGNLGEIDVEVLNGCPPYTYSWTGPGGFTSSFQDLTGLVDGTYQVTVTDDAGNIFVSDPIVVSTLVLGIDNAVVVNTCNNGANGSISFEIINGIDPYDITWSSPQNPGINTTYTTNNTFVTLTNLKNATYNLSILDALGCTYDTSFVIQNAPPIVIDSTVWAPSCFSACDGRIDLSITGGVGAPYTILWNTGDTTPSIEDLCAGIYSASVVDSNGCSASFGVNLNGASAAPMEITEIIINPNFEQGTPGSIQISSVTNGGGAPYTYVWTDSNSQIIGTDPLLSDLSEGTYTVTVTGAAGCSISRTYTLQSRCDAFSYPEYRLQLYKFQCCAGQLAKKYVQLVEAGRTDLAKCLEMDLKYMTVVLDSLSCITSFPDPCLSCDDLNSIFNQMKKICDCDCCESDENAYTVRYDYDTQTFIPVIPEVSGGNPGGPVQCPPNCPPPQP